MRVKRFYRQILAYLAPIKGFGTVGMYQRIIAICIWLMIAGISLAIAMCAFMQTNKWANLIENIGIGIACSAIIMLFSSSIEFVHKRDVILSEYSDIMLQLLVVLLSVADSKEQKDEEECKISYAQISELFDEYIRMGNSSLFWFEIRKFDIYLGLCTKMLKIELPFIKDEEPCETINNLDRQMIVECIRDMKCLTENDYLVKSKIFNFLLNEAENGRND